MGVNKWPEDLRKIWTVDDITWEGFRAQLQTYQYREDASSWLLNTLGLSGMGESRALFAFKPSDIKSFDLITSLVDADEGAGLGYGSISMDMLSPEAFSFLKEYMVDEKEQAKQNESSLSHKKSNKTQIIVDIDQNTHRKSISYFNIDSFQKEEKQDSSFT
jgi:hypothetical protein